MAKRKKMSNKEFSKFLKDAQADPQVKKDIKKFIKITTNPYNLKDYGLEDIGY